MPEFHYYEIDRDAMTPALRKRLFAIPELRMRPAVEGTDWLVRSPTPMPRFKGGRLVKEERWTDSLVPKPPPPVMSAAPSLISAAWRIASATRQARISRRLLVPKRSALQLKFGAGSGDAVSLEVETPIPSGATGLRLELQTPAGITLSVAPDLRSARGRPLTSLEARDVSKAGSSILDWALPEFAAGERARVAWLWLTLSTDADAATVVLTTIAFTV